MSALPSSINYRQPIPVLPDQTKSYTLTATPINGSVFGPSSVIQVDLGRSGFIPPDSIYLRYKATVTNVTSYGNLAGCPVYTPFLRQETIIGSQVVDTINQFNQTANLLTNLTMDVAGKYGAQPLYGYDQQTANGNLAFMDGRRVPIAGETYTVAAPLIGLLTNCEKLIPSFAMPTIRLQFTMDTIANMFCAPTDVSGFSISNFEIVYTSVQMGSEIEAMVMSSPFYIKSQSFFNTSTFLATATSGSVSIPFNVNFASIKACIFNFGGTTANSFNKSLDSYDMTSSNGEYSLNIGGISYPQRALSTLHSKASILQELRKCVGSIFSSSNSLSINNLEFNRVGNDLTSSSEPGKFYVGFCTEKLASEALLTGISSQGSAILLNVSLGSPTAQAHSINLIVNYDALLHIDPENLQVSVKR